MTGSNNKRRAALTDEGLASELRARRDSLSLRKRELEAEGAGILAKIRGRVLDTPGYRAACARQAEIHDESVGLERDMLALKRELAALAPHAQWSEEQRRDRKDLIEGVKRVLFYAEGVAETNIKGSPLALFADGVVTRLAELLEKTK